MRDHIADQLGGFRNRPGMTQGTIELPRGKPRDLPASRTVIYAGAREIVSVKVAHRSLVVNSAHVGRPYVSLLRSVKGGRVSLFLYGRDSQHIEELLGSTVRAELDSIMLRTYSDGKVSVYIDLKVVEDGLQTHDLNVIGRTDDCKRDSETILSYAVPSTDGVIELRKHVAKKPREKSHA